MDRKLFKIRSKRTNVIKLSQSDMAFTDNGITPDIMINANAIPSRMTISQLIETVAGKVASLEGNEIDATPYLDFDLDDIRNRLKSFGYDENGFEALYNGMSGRKMKSLFFIGPTYYQRLKHLVMDKIHCLTLDHEVLTKLGYKLFNKLTIDDEIACLVDGTLVYEKPIKLLYYPNYKGNIYRVESKYIDLNVTDNHRMWVKNKNSNKYELIEAKEIYNKKNIKYQITAKNNNKYFKFILPGCSNNENNQYLPKYLDMDELLIVLGYWITNKKYNENNVVGKISWDKTENSNPLIYSLTNLKYKLIKCDNSIAINDVQLCNYLNKNCKNQLPEWVFDMNKIQTQLLLDIIVYSSDNLFTENKMFYTTNNKQLADDIMRLSLHAEWSAKINTFSYNNNDNDNDNNKNNSNYRISIIKEEYKCDNNNKETMTYYEGAVFCLQVSSQVFYVRRNGKGVWTGNSRAKGPVTILTRQAPEGRSRDGGLRFGEMERDAILAHGLALFLKERLLETADVYHTYVCGSCGLFAQRMIRKDNKSYPTKQDIYYCPACKNSFDVFKIRIPYAFKLLIQELLSMCIAPRIRIKKSSYE